MGSDVDGEVIGSEFKGYTLRITGGNDKQGFVETRELYLDR